MHVGALLLSTAPCGSCEEVRLCCEQGDPLLLQTSSDVLLCLSEDRAAGSGWEVVRVGPALTGNHLGEGGRGISVLVYVCVRACVSVSSLNSATVVLDIAHTYIHTYVCTHVGYIYIQVDCCLLCTRIHMCTRAYVHTHTHTYIRTHIYTQIRVYKRTSIQMHTWAHRPGPPASAAPWRRGCWQQRSTSCRGTLT